MFERIVVGLDGSAASRSALDFAGTLAGRLGSRVTIVSVIEELPPYVAALSAETKAAAEAREYYGELQRSALQRLRRRGVSAGCEIRVGNEGRAILQAVRDMDADLLAVGHAGHSGAWGSSLGSTAARLAQAAPCAVLVARAGSASAGVRRLLVGVDGSAPARRALEVAGTLASELGARLVVGIAADASASSVEPRRSPLPPDPHVDHAVAPEIMTVRGDPARGLLTLAAQADCQLVVVGSTGQRHPWAPGLGPTASHVLDRADVSVLIVRLPGVNAPVSGIMRRRVHVAHPETSIREATGLLLRLGVKSLPIVDGEGRVLGIITLGDLLRRAGVGVRPEVASAVEPQELRQYLEQLESGSRTCAEVMTGDVVTIRPDASLSEVVATLSHHHVKRLPVVDGDGRLRGIVSRADVLRALAGAPEREGSPVRSPGGSHVASDVMDAAVVTIGRDTPAEDAAAAVLGSDFGRVAVVDAGERVVGVLATRDLLPLASGDTRRQLFEALVAAPGPREALGVAFRREAQHLVAGDLMRREVVTVLPNADLGDVLAVMMARSLKRLLVVDEGRRILGAVDRASVLRAIAATLAET